MILETVLLFWAFLGFTNGISGDWSPPLPDLLSASVVPDCTISDHAVIMISWIPPTDLAADQEYGGELVLSANEGRGKCLQLNFTEIDPFPASAGSVRIRADQSTSHPVYGCHYTFILFSGSENIRKNVSVPDQQPGSNFQYNCSGVFNPRTHSYTLVLEWMLQSNGCLDSSAIDQFNVTLLLKNATVRESVIGLNSNNTEEGLYRVTYTNMKLVLHAVYTFMLTAEPSELFPSLAVSSCSVATPPLPPERISFVQVAEYSQYNASIILKALWSPPMVTNGPLDYYYILISSGPEQNPLFEYVVPASQPSIDRKFDIKEDVTDLFLQIRSSNAICPRFNHSETCFSPWSEPVSLKPTVCHVPASQSNFNTLLLNEEHSAVTRAKCYATCINKFANQSVLESMKSGDVWPSVLRGDLECSLANKVDLCYKGCVLSVGSPRNYVCTYDCVTQCKSECGGGLSCREARGSGRGDCQRTCEFVPCSIGCGIRANLDRIIPRPPIGYPVAMSTMSIDGGLYDITIKSNKSNVRQQEDSLVSDHAFVVRIREKSGRESYIVQQSLSMPLNLAYFSCQTVDVSVSVVTSTDMSEYTDPTTFFVYGETLFPSHPDVSKFNYYVEEDLRPGFFKHIILTISWERPENYRFVEFYKVRLSALFTFSCGSPREYNVAKNATSIVIQSDTSRDPPKFFCHYFVEVQSIPSLPGDKPRKKLEYFNRVSADPPPMPVECSYIGQDDKTGYISVSVTWTYQLEKHLLEATQYFLINRRYVPGRNTNIYGFPIGRINEKIIYSFDKINYTDAFVFEPTRIGSTFDTARVQIQSFRSRKYRWRKLPKTEFCFFNAKSLPPTQIEFSNVTVLQVSQFIHLEIQWVPPNPSYGEIVQYDLVVSSSEQSPSQSLIPPDSISVNTKDANITLRELNRFPSNVSCLYLQGRAKTKYAVSMWSKAYKFGDSDCTIENAVPEVVSSPLPSPSVSLSSEAVVEASPVTLVNEPESRGLDSESDPQSLRHVAFHMSLSLPVAVGTVFLIVLVIMVITGVVLLKHKRNKKLRATLEGKIGKEWSSGRRAHLTNGLVFDDWELSIGDIVIGEKLSEGVFGQVYRGTVKGPCKNKKVPPEIRRLADIPVAIKMLKDDAEGKDKTDFFNEIDVMKKISEGTVSPHIMSMIGCVTVQEPIVLVTALVKHGDLWNYLQHIRQSLIHPKPNMPEESLKSVEEDENPYKSLGSLSPVDLLSFAYQIASGMEFLSGIGVVHRDLAARNVLVEDQKTLKISDFGMARIVGQEEAYVKTTRGKLPWKWMAVESIRQNEFNSCSDVWSYGVTLWEIATLGGFPYPSVPNTELLQHLDGGARLERPPNVSTDVYKVMLSCWKQAPTERPTFSDLRNTFSTFISTGSSSPYIDLMVDPNQPYYNYDLDMFIELTEGYDHIEKIDDYDHIDILKVLAGPENAYENKVKDNVEV